MNKKREIPIVLAFTPDYFIPAATCLYSLFSHACQGQNFHVICLLTEVLPERLQQKIRLIGKGKSYYSFINLQHCLHNIYVADKYTIAASYRLLLPDLLPEYSKVIYLDCDMIVRNDLGKLYHAVALGENYLAAVFETPLDFQKEHIEAVGCDPESYFNSGFLIMNLDLLRRDKMVQQFIEASKADDLEFPDQDVLNSLCKGRVIGLPPFYNSIRTFYLPQYKKCFLKKYTEQDWKEVHLHGTVHYTGAKPWKHFTIEFAVWWQYYKALPKVIKVEGNVNKRMYILFCFYRSCVGGLLINSFRFLYRKLKY